MVSMWTILLNEENLVLRVISLNKTYCSTCPDKIYLPYFHWYPFSKLLLVSFRILYDTAFWYMYSILEHHGNNLPFVVGTLENILKPILHKVDSNNIKAIYIQRRNSWSKSDSLKFELSYLMKKIWFLGSQQNFNK